jgi:hypothetical protein
LFEQALNSFCKNSLWRGNLLVTWQAAGKVFYFSKFFTAKSGASVCLVQQKARKIQLKSHFIFV